MNSLTFEISTQPPDPGDELEAYLIAAKVSDEDRQALHREITNTGDGDHGAQFWDLQLAGPPDVLARVKAALLQAGSVDPDDLREDGAQCPT